MKLFVLLVAVSFASAKVSYEGYQVWRLDVSKDQIAEVLELVVEHELDVWASGTDWMDVMISPKKKVVIKEAFAILAVHSKINILNVQPLIDRDYQNQQRQSSVDFDFEVYHTYDEIEAYLSEVAASDKRTSLVSLGQTNELREMWQLKVSVGKGKQAVWVDCGIHAREWITPATCLWGINYLLTSYGTDQSVTDLLNAYDLYFLPVDNPDGYVYTHTDDRMWRKNRSVNRGSICRGVDLNRNFDDHFGGAGTSSNECSEVYKGPFAASEPETKNVQAGITALAPKALFSIHSYGDLWMYAFGWTDELPSESDELHEVSVIGVAAIEAVNGILYKYGPIFTTIYPAASTTVDYGYDAGIVHTYTLELRDKGAYGFLLPEDEIAETATETWAGLIAGIMAIP